MKPFNLEEALAGKPVVTRSGAKVTQIMKLDIAETRYPIFAVIDKKTHATFTLDGYLYADRMTNANDLFMFVPEPVKKTYYINVYPKNIRLFGNYGIRSFSFLGEFLASSKGNILFDSAESAKNNAVSGAIGQAVITVEE